MNPIELSNRFLHRCVLLIQPKVCFSIPFVIAADNTDVLYRIGHPFSNRQCRIHQLLSNVQLRSLVKSNSAAKVFASAPLCFDH
jgi:hypothetical protein